MSLISRTSLGKLGTLPRLAYSEHHSVIWLRKRTEAVETKGPGIREQRREAGLLTLPVLTPDTNYNQFSLKVAYDPSSQPGTQSCSRCLLRYGGLPGHNEDFMSQEEDSFTEASSLWEEACPTSSFCTFSSHNVSRSQHGLEKSLLSVTGQNTAKRFRICNEAISWHPGHVTLG